MNGKNERKTRCGIDYDLMIEKNISTFSSRLAGQWHRVTCANCFRTIGVKLPVWMPRMLKPKEHKAVLDEVMAMALKDSDSRFRMFIIRAMEKANK